ncbi:MAG: signal peptide peptidase SppA, type [Hyphomicrobiales bacterium]|nr:signal peptide peptidase SppA, type [Hyphomicrobiales bacterium]
MADLIADHLIDRTRLRRKLSFWRVTAALCLVAAIGALAWRFGGTPAANLPHVARLSVTGLVTGDRETLKLIDDVAKSSASAVILNVDSPGGTTTGAEKIYEELRRLAARKPVVAVIGTTGASGAYIAAMGADRIFARGNSLVGSIGVLFQFPNLGGLLNTLGVKVEEVKSSPLKAAPNPFETATPEARAALAALVSDSYDWFRGLVRERRALNDAELATVADGRVFTGRQALGVKLVDQLGGEREAIAWLEAEKNVAKDLPVRDWRPPSRTGRLGLFSVTASLADVFGFPDAASLLRQGAEAADARALDGLLSLWHGRVGS